VDVSKIAVRDVLDVKAFEPVTVAVIGCGQRGNSYATYAITNPEQCKVVAIAEPRPKAQKIFANAHEVDQSLVFSSWKDLHSASVENIQTFGKRLVDAIIIAVQDSMHLEVALAFADQGYHILCEKPMATRLEDCMKMEETVKKRGVIFGCGHVLRYSPYNQALVEVIRSGTLGQLMNIVHIEPVGYFHFAHSFVRGNWGKEKDSCFSLMTKSCHDIDILRHYMAPVAPTRVSSFGSLLHFRKEAKPKEAGAATRCLDCSYQTECPYSAKKIYLDRVSAGHKGWPLTPIVDGIPDIENVTAAAVYLDRVSAGHKGWPLTTIVDGIPDIENVTAALEYGPYGQCVYESENDVCDNQVVNLEFSNGATASFTMIATTQLICERQTRLHFAHGEIIGDMSTFTVTNFRTGESKRHVPKNEGGGHGGGDLGLIRAFVEAVRTGSQEPLGTDVSDVFQSHLTVFAAEQSRREGKVIDCVEFEKEARAKMAEAESGQSL